MFFFLRCPSTVVIHNVKIVTCGADLFQRRTILNLVEEWWSLVKLAHIMFGAVLSERSGHGVVEEAGSFLRQF